MLNLKPPRHTPTFMGPLRVKRVRRGNPGTIRAGDPTTIKWRRFGDVRGKGVVDKSRVSLRRGPLRWGLRVGISVCWVLVLDGFGAVR